MLEAVTRWSMARPWLIACACVWFMAWSLFFVRDLRVDFLPALAPAQASIQTEAPGLVSEQGEQLVTRPIESRLIGAAGVGAVSSQSGQGLSIVTVRFADGADPFPGGKVVRYVWNWGDGTSTITTANSASHTYKSDRATRTITLTVTDNYGMTGSTSRKVKIK